MLRSSVSLLAKPEPRPPSEKPERMMTGYDSLLAMISASAMLLQALLGAIFSPILVSS
jgi:hypothetical protein